MEGDHKLLYSPLRAIGKTVPICLGTHSRKKLSCMCKRKNDDFHFNIVTMKN